jgi:hypothetical protein
MQQLAIANITLARFDVTSRYAGVVASSSVPMLSRDSDPLPNWIIPIKGGHRRFLLDGPDAIQNVWNASGLMLRSSCFHVIGAAIGKPGRARGE